MAENWISSYSLYATNTWAQEELEKEADPMTTLRYEGSGFVLPAQFISHLKLWALIVSREEGARDLDYRNDQQLAILHLLENDPHYWPCSQELQKVGRIVHRLEGELTELRAEADGK